MRSDIIIFQTYLNPLTKVNKRQWTEEEDSELIELVEEFGGKWSKISKLLKNGKNDHMVKNRYLSLKKKKDVRIYKSDYN